MISIQPAILEQENKQAVTLSKWQEMAKLPIS